MPTNLKLFCAGGEGWLCSRACMLCGLGEGQRVRGLGMGWGRWLGGFCDG